MSRSLTTAPYPPSCDRPGNSHAPSCRTAAATCYRVSHGYLVPLYPALHLSNCPTACALFADTCRPVPGPINADTCGGLVELYGIIPGPTTNWGTAHAQAREGYLAGGRSWAGPV